MAVCRKFEQIDDDNSKVTPEKKAQLLQRRKKYIEIRVQKDIKMKCRKDRKGS